MKFLIAFLSSALLYIRALLDCAGKGQQGPVDFKWIYPASRRMQLKSACFRQAGPYVISTSTYR